MLLALLHEQGHTKPPRPPKVQPPKLAPQSCQHCGPVRFSLLAPAGRRRDLEQEGQSGQDRKQSNPATCPRLLLCPEHPALCQDRVRTPRAPETWGRPLQGSGRTPKATSLCIVCTLACLCSNQAQLGMKKGTRQDPGCVYPRRWAPVTFEESTSKGQPPAPQESSALQSWAGHAGPPSAGWHVPLASPLKPTPSAPPASRSLHWR